MFRSPARRPCSDHLDWVPRELNQEADDLSNGIVAAFTPQLRVPVDLGNLEWKVLGRLMAEGSVYFEATRSKKAVAAVSRERDRNRLARARR